MFALIGGPIMTDLFTRPDFDSFYERYPKKKAPKVAVTAYNEQLKEGVSPEHLQEAVEAYRALWDEHISKMTAKQRKAAKVFVPYPATWLRAGDYDDEDIKEYLSKPKEPEQVIIKKGEPGYSEWTKHDPTIKTWGNVIVVSGPYPPEVNVSRETEKSA